MEGLTQGTGAVMLMTVIMYAQPVFMATPETMLNGDCGLRWVNVNDDKSTLKEAKNNDRWIDHTCKVVYRALKSTDTLYLIFKKFDVEDCDVKLDVFFGEENAKKEYDCNNSPTIDEVYYQEGEYNLTMLLQKADQAKKAFSFQVELTTNSSVLSPGTSPMNEKMSLLTVLFLGLAALVISSVWNK